MPVSPQGGARDEALPQAKAAAIQALKLDSTSSEAYVSLGLLESNRQAGAEYFRKALRLNPSNLFALQRYYFELLARSRFEEALSTAKKTARLDPLSPLSNLGVGTAHYFARNYEQALIEFQETLVMYPDFAVAYYMIGLTHAAMDKYDIALKNLKKAYDLNPNDEYKEWIGYVYARSGKKERALEILEELKQPGELMYIALGEIDSAFKILNNKPEVYPLILVAPPFDPIRSDPRFEELVKRAGFEE